MIVLVVGLTFSSWTIYLTIDNIFLGTMLFLMLMEWIVSPKFLFWSAHLQCALPFQDRASLQAIKLNEDKGARLQYNRKHDFMRWKLDTRSLTLSEHPGKGQVRTQWGCPGRNNPYRTLVLKFENPELRIYRILLLDPLSLWCSLMATKVEHWI